MSGKRVVRRSLAVGLGMICVILIVGVVGAAMAYASMASGKDNAIASKDSQIASLNSQLSSLESQVSSLNAQLVNLKNQVDNLTNWLNATATPVGKSVLDLSALVNETVVVEGEITGPLVFIPEGMPPWSYELDSNGTVIGISWNGGDFFNWTSVRVYGVVTQGTLSGGLTEPPGTVYYVKAERIDLL